MDNRGNPPEVVSPNQNEDASVGASGSGATPEPGAPLSGPEASWSVQKDLFDQISGLSLDPRILEVRPQGSRLVVMVNPPPEEHGGLILPEKWRDMEREGSGWVVATGPDVGMARGRAHPGGPNCAPWALLYKQVIFGAYSGKILRVDFYDRNTKSPYIILNDRDIWAIDLTPSEHQKA